MKKKWERIFFFLFFFHFYLYHERFFNRLTEFDCIPPLFPLRDSSSLNVREIFSPLRCGGVCVDSVTVLSVVRGI